MSIMVANTDEIGVFKITLSPEDVSRFHAIGSAVGCPPGYEVQTAIAEMLKDGLGMVDTLMNTSLPDFARALEIAAGKNKC